MKSRSISLSAFCLCLAIQLVSTVGTAQEPSGDENAYRAATASDPAIDVDRLKVLLRPLTKVELEVEASEWLEQLRSKITEVGATELKIKSLGADEDGAELTKQLISLRTEESDMVEHVRIVLAALQAKGGDVEESEQYLSAVTDLGETTDATSYWAAVVASARTWIASEDGGQLMARRVIVALLILLAFWVMSKFAGRIISRWLAKQPRASTLLEDFARRTTGGVVRPEHRSFGRLHLLYRRRKPRTRRLHLLLRACFRPRRGRGCPDGDERHLLHGGPAARPHLPAIAGRRRRRWWWRRWRRTARGHRLRPAPAPDRRGHLSAHTRSCSSSPRPSTRAISAPWR